MSVDKPIEQVTFSGSEEVRRAVLDEYMVLYQPEIERSLSDFRDHKSGLLSLLFDDYNHLSDSHEKVWFRIETIAYQFFARQKLKEIVKSSANQAAQYRAIADTSQRAIRKIEKLRHADIARAQIKPWVDGIIGFADATQEFSNRLNVAVEFDLKIERALKGLIELEEAANRAANEVHKGRGRPDGTSLLPKSYILELAEIYETNAGQRPITGGSAFAGPFADFVQQFLIAVGEEKAIENGYVFEAPKYMRRKQKRAGSKTPSRPSGNARRRE